MPNTCRRQLSFYFSASRYSTVGYGDVILPRVRRALGDATFARNPATPRKSQTISVTDVITPEDQDIRLFCSHDLFLDLN